MTSIASRYIHIYDLIGTHPPPSKAELEMTQAMAIMHVNNKCHQAKLTPAYAEVNQYSTSTIHS